MDGTLHLECARYRQDLAWVRKCLELNRTGRDMSIRVVASIPGGGPPASVDVFLSRWDVWVVGFRTNSVAVKFQDTNPSIDGVDFTRTLPFSPSYTRLDPFSDQTQYGDPSPFYSGIAALQSVNHTSRFRREHERGLNVVIFALSEALRFWQIDLAISKALCGTGTFRFMDWKEAVNNWDRRSRSGQRGALLGVQLPTVKGLTS